MPFRSPLAVGFGFAAVVVPLFTLGHLGVSDSAADSTTVMLELTKVANEIADDQGQLAEKFKLNERRLEEAKKAYLTTRQQRAIFIEEDTQSLLVTEAIILEQEIRAERVEKNARHAQLNTERANEKLRQIEKEIAERASQIAKLEKERKKLAGKMTSLDKRLSMVTGNLKQVKKDNSKLSNSIKNLEHKSHRLEEKLEKLREQKDHNYRSVEERKRELRGLK